MGTNKLLPGGCGLALWRWGDAMPLEDIAHRLIAHAVAKIGQCARNPIIPPGAVLPRHAHHERLQFLINRGTPWGLPLLGAIKLLGDQLPMSCADRIGFGDGRDFLQRVLPELLANYRQGLSSTVTEPQTALDLLTEHTIFGDEVLITQQQLLVH